MSTKTPKVGRPPKDSDLLRFRTDREIIDGIDAAAGDESDNPSRPEMLRRIVRDWLTGHGYLEPE